MGPLPQARMSSRFAELKRHLYPMSEAWLAIEPCRTNVVPMDEGLSRGVVRIVVRLQTASCLGNIWYPGRCGLRQFTIWINLLELTQGRRAWLLWRSRSQSLAA